MLNYVWYPVLKTGRKQKSEIYFGKIFTQMVLLFKSLFIQLENAHYK